MLDSQGPATTIVVGVDGSPRSEDAISFAGRLAGAIGARVALVCAYGYGRLADKFGGAVEVRDLGTGLRHEAEAVLRRARDLLPGVVAVTTQAVAEPSPARALHDAAVESSASLVVLGSSHVGRLGRIRPGSTAERLLHGAPCPVMIVPRGMPRHEGAPAGPIGIAYDGSAECKMALGAAVAAARALSAPLHVVEVCDVGRYSAPAVQYGPGYYASADSARDDAAIELAAGAATIPDDVDVEQVLLLGNPARELVEASAGLGMLFVGSRGYGPLRSVLLGGVGGILVRGAACPVIVTPRGAAVDTATAIVVLTMHDDPSFARSALQGGASGFVLKEAADEELLEAIRSVAAGGTYLNPRMGARIAAEPPAPSGPPDDLTERELEVLRLIALGHTNAEIGARLFLSTRTVETHRAHIQQKLCRTSRAELVRYALDHDLVGE